MLPYFLFPAFLVPFYPLCISPGDLQESLQEIGRRMLQWVPGWWRHQSCRALGIFESLMEHHNWHAMVSLMFFLQK